MEVRVRSLPAVAARVGQGCEWRYADADQTSRNLCCAPQKNFGLVICYVWAFARPDADLQADYAECRSQKAKGKEQNHAHFSLYSRIEIPGDFDRDQQDEYVRKSIERSAGIEQVGNIDTRSRLSLVPYSFSRRTLKNLGKCDCDIEK